MKFPFWLIAIFSLFGCSQSISKKVQIANKVREKTAEKLHREIDLVPMGFGGQMMDQIKMMKLVFQYRHPISLDQGREILLHATNEFLNQINSTQSILPFLYEQPFQSKNIVVTIVITNSDGSKVHPGSLCMLVCEDGYLQYETHDLNSDKLTTIYKESYEEALKISWHQEDMKRPTSILKK